MTTATAPAPSLSTFLPALADAARQSFAIAVQESRLDIADYDSNPCRRREWAVSMLADALREAARVSVTLPMNPDTGRRFGCKLEELIPDDGGHNPTIREAVALVTGKAYSWPRYQGADTEAVYGPREDAAFLRAQLRRWAVRNAG